MSGERGKITRMEETTKFTSGKNRLHYNMEQKRATITSTDSIGENASTCHFAHTDLYSSMMDEKKSILLFMTDKTK